MSNAASCGVIKQLLLMDLTIGVQKHCLDVQVFPREGQVFALQHICVHVHLLADPLLCASERLNHGLLLDQARVELHAEVVDEVELEAHQVIRIHSLNSVELARSHLLVFVLLIEAQDVLDLQALENLPEFDTVRQSNANDVDLQPERLYLPKGLLEVLERVLVADAVAAFDA